MISYICCHNYIASRIPAPPPPPHTDGNLIVFFLRLSPTTIIWVGCVVLMTVWSGTIVVEAYFRVSEMQNEQLERQNGGFPDAAVSFRAVFMSNGLLKRSD